MRANPRAGAVLERALATDYRPGTNRRGDAAGAAWSLLLDDLDLGHVVCLGPPGRRSLRTLAARAAAVTVVAPSGAGGRADADGAANIAFVTARDAGAIPRADVTVVTGSRWARRAAADPAVATLLARSRRVYVEHDGDPRAVTDVAAAAGPFRPLWLGVRGGEVELACATDDAAARSLLSPPAPRRRVGPRALAREARALRRGRLREARAALATGRAAPGPGIPLPAYLRDLAGGAGAPVDACHVALSAPGDYPSRKAVLFVLEGNAARPRLVVKVARDPAVNPRLINEWRALRAVAGTGMGDLGPVPAAAFLGRRAGLVVLGQGAILGAPFARRTTGTAQCPVARRAAGWLLELGVRTADRDAASSVDAAAALGRLLDRYVAVYRPGPGEEAALRDQVASVGASPLPFPVVLQHGDPGQWNVLVGEDGRPSFLDWEAAERQGMPLWDLFHFTRSVGVSIARRHGARRPAPDGGLLDDGPLARALAADAERHCAQIGLDPDLVGPLFLLCWMHRALKEATRLDPARLGSGRYVRLLRAALERRSGGAEGAVAWLVGAPGTGTVAG